MTVILDYTITQKQLSDIAQGKDRSLPRNIAINMLPASKIRNSVSILNTLLLDENEDATARRLAAVNLWKSNTATAHGHLLKAAGTVTNPEILGALVKALGRVGGKNAFDTVVAIENKAQGLLKSQAAFAASLLSYRHGIPGHDLPVPKTYLPMPVEGQERLKFNAPAPEEVEIFTSSLAREPYGISFSKELMQQFSCQRGGWMMAFNKELSTDGGLSILTSRKTLLGVLAGKNSADGRYSTSCLMLSSPGRAKGTVNILIYRITGSAVWAGTASVKGNEANFKLQTAGSLGVVPMEMEGSLAAGGTLTIKRAVSATRVTTKKQPSPRL